MKSWNMKSAVFVLFRSRSFCLSFCQISDWKFCGSFLFNQSEELESFRKLKIDIRTGLFIQVHNFAYDFVPPNKVNFREVSYSFKMTTSHCWRTSTSNKENCHSFIFVSLTFRPIFKVFYILKSSLDLLSFNINVHDLREPPKG